MASFATEGESAAELFEQPNFWKSSTLLDLPTPLGKDFFDLVVKREHEPFYLICMYEVLNQW